MVSPEVTPTISPKQAHARGSLRAWLLFAVPAIVGIAADLWTKAYAFPADGVPFVAGRHGFDPPAAIIPGILGFRTTVNYGAVFGLGQHKGVVFVAFSILALCAILWVFLTSKRKQFWTHLALGLILGGAVGNLYDRIAYGFVRDFMIFNVRWYPYIFNVADVLLCIGVPLLMICWLFAPAPPSGKPDLSAEKKSAGTAE